MGLIDPHIGAEHLLTLCYPADVGAVAGRRQPAGAASRLARGRWPVRDGRIARHPVPVRGLRRPAELTRRDFASTMLAGTVGAQDDPRRAEKAAGMRLGPGHNGQRYGVTRAVIVPFSSEPMDPRPSSPDPAADCVLPPMAQRLSVYVSWGSLVGLAFFGIYPATNWLAALRASPHQLFLPQELGIPFVPAFIWPYLSLYLLFLSPPFFLGPSQLKRLGQRLILATVIAGIVFVALPAQLGFSSVLPEEAFYRDLFDSLFAIDQPFNMVPSLHVVYATAISLAVMGCAGTLVRAVFWVWLSLIVASTVFVHQHHLLDVVTGMVLASMVHLSLREEENV